MDRHQSKRSAEAQDGGPSQKKPKLGGAAAGGSGGGGKMSFAERMLAKMGHKAGEGLGKDGSGMLSPIEVKLRPQGAGVGAVKEKTSQAKAEAKRAAERRGEKYEDSSDEEKKARRKRKEANKSGRTSGYNTPTRAKPKIRTAAEIEAESGLRVPDVFKSLLDLTGGQPKLLTSTVGLMIPQTTGLSTDIETNKIATYARRELEHFAQAHKDNKDRMEYVHAEEERIQVEIAQLNQQAELLRNIYEAVEAISSLSLGSVSVLKNVTDNRLEETVSRLEELQTQYGDFVEPNELVQVAVAAISPYFKTFISGWDPLLEPARFVVQLQRLDAILGIRRARPSSLHDTGLDVPDRDKTMNAYEAMIYTIWLPKVRTVVVNQWEPTDSTPMIDLIRNWRGVLPQPVYDVVVNQLVVQRLSDTLKAWKPGHHRKERKSSPELHTWLFPWLEYLDDYHLDPRSSAGLLADVRRKLRSYFDTWNPSKGTIPGLERWQEVHALRPEINKDLEVKLLPALARYLNDHFIVDPADQDITSLEAVFKWSNFFKPEKFCRIFLDAFFPKWLNILYEWLTSDPNYDEIGQWYAWWQGVFPGEINSEPAMALEWEKGLTMINQALEIGPMHVKNELSKPVAGPTRPIAPSSHRKSDVAAKEKIRSQVQEAAKAEISFKDLLEELCEQESLLLVPMRQAHPITGLPLFRITASASGVGGVALYIQGDVAYVQSKKDRNRWDFVDLFEPGILAALAEGR